jgi:DNA-binding response OmpR family regulator
MAALLEKPYQTDELLLIVKYAFDRRTQPHSKGSSARAAIPETSGKRNRILLVEDDEKIALGLEIRLKAAGYETLLAHDGLDAVNVAVKQRPDLVLLDISMPAGNGFTVAKRIQTAIPTPIPIIFLTASKRPEFRQQAEEIGAIGFFEKPFDAEELLTTISTTLAVGRLAFQKGSVSPHNQGRMSMT